MADYMVGDIVSISILGAPAQDYIVTSRTGLSVNLEPAKPKKIVIKTNGDPEKEREALLKAAASGKW